MITIDPKALKQLKAIQCEDPSLSYAALRISAKGGGCSGLRYSLDFDTDAPLKSDTTLTIEGLRVLIDDKSASVLEGLVISYSDGLNGKGFEFSNPKATRTCGCGQSFGC